MKRLTVKCCKSADALRHRGLLPQFMVLFLAFLMAACSAAQTTGREQAQTQQSVNSATPRNNDNMPSLHFVWNTNFSSYIFVPGDVRKKALKACEARGYEHTVMASISLDANEAAADFTCSGSYE